MDQTKEDKEKTTQKPLDDLAGDKEIVEEGEPVSGLSQVLDSA